MRLRVLVALWLGLSACRSQPGAAGDSAPRALEARVLDAGVAGEGAAVQEPWDARGRVLPTQARIGEPFTYELVLTHGKDQRFELVPPRELEQFEVLEQTRQRVDGAERSVTTFRLKMSAFELGALTLPELTFELTAPAGTQTVAVPGMQVEVVPTLPPDAEKQGEGLFDYQPPTEVPIRTWRLVWALLGLLAAGLLGWALLRWLRRLRSAEAPVKPLEPLDVRTRQALDALKAEALPTQGQVKAFYFRLSEIIRGYLGERYGFEALECTSPELLASLRRLPTPGLPEEQLRHFVSESDLVKYAKAEASPESCEAALAFGYELIEKTYTPPAPPSAPPAAHAAGTRVS